MTKKPTSKTASKRKAEPRVTVVPDRSAWSLGREAKIVAHFLRGVGAEGARAVRPGSSSDAERRDWLESESRFVKRVPMWMLDFAVAILEQIPNQEDRPQGRRPEDATTQVELLRAGNISTADAAKLVAEMEAARAWAATGKRPSADAIASRAKKIARRIYRRKRDVPK